MNLRANFFMFSKLASLAGGLVALTASAQTAATFGNLSLYFEAGADAQFVARGHDAEFSVSPAQAQLLLQKNSVPRAVQMRFIGANPLAEIHGDGELDGKINYLTGNDPAKWRSSIATFAKVRVAEIYPGIGVAYYGNQRQLEYDFTVAPGADPDSIAIHFDGADKISINPNGELILKLGRDEIVQPKPVIYQSIRGARQEISGGYKILDAHTVAFAVGKYDGALPLVIDPVLAYATYFGGASSETAWAVAVNPNDGSIYIAGQTLSAKLSTNAPPGAFQPNFAGGTQAGDAFVARFDNLGTHLIYLTYLGGSADDAAYGLAVDSAGNAYVAGATVSANFPIKNAIPGHANISGPFYTAFGSYAADAFVAELNSGGSNLIYSTYLGGEAPDAAYGIAVDSSGDAYVTGFTYSTNFPAANAVQNHLACINSFDVNANAFVSEITNGGGALVFSTYLGGTNFDTGKGIAVDANGFIYVTGFTSSTNFPTTNYISQVIGTNSYNGHFLGGATNNLNSASDAFVTKYFPSGSNYVYSTFLGGSFNDGANAIAVDGSGAYVTGWTISANFPDTVATNVIGNQLTNNLSGFIITTNAFLTKITNSIGTSAGIAYSAVFGGNAGDIGNGVAVDASGDAFVVGSTTSTSSNFPTADTSGFLRPTNSGGSDVFVTAFNADASAVLYSAYLGGSGNDFGYGIAVDSSTNVYVAGQTSSLTNFVTASAFQKNLNGANDAFLAKISVQSPAPPALAIFSSGNTNVILSWSALDPTFQLQSNTNLASTNWMTVPNPPLFTNGLETVALPATNIDLFFRLLKF
jgi:hypothetical protein